MKKGFGNTKQSQKVTKKKSKKKKRNTEIKKSLNYQKQKSLTFEEREQKWTDYAYKNLGKDIIVSYDYLSRQYWEYPKRIVEKAIEIFEGNEGRKFLNEVYFDDLEDGVIEHIAKEKGGENWLCIYRKLIRALSIASYYIDTMDDEEDNYIELDEVQDCLSSFQKRKIDYGLMTVEKLRNQFLIF